MATVIAITCPSCGLALADIDSNFKRNTAEDRASHIHIEITDQVQCVNVVTPHAWRIVGDLTLRPV